jgi:small-conductance mechanosensitive channel
MELALLQVQLDRIESLFRDGLRASVHVGVAALLSLIIIWIAKRFGKYSARRIAERGGADEIELEKQTATIITLVRRVLLTLLWALAMILALEEFGFEVKPLLAGAGVAGIAVGFAAQSILKDWISGFFLITEGQIRIDDVLKVGDLSGSVEKITLRTISLRGFDGSLHVISNGSITAFSNQTLLFSYYVFDVCADHGQDPGRMMVLMREVDQSLREDPTFSGIILEPLEISGVDRFTEQGVVVKARIKTVASKQWSVGREFLRRLKQRCDETGVTIATAQRAVQLFEKHDSATPVRRALLDPSLREEMKDIVRDVLRSGRDETRSRSGTEESS